MDKPKDLKFCSGVKHLKIYDMCPRVFQNLDQGPDRTLKIFFLNMARTLEKKIEKGKQKTKNKRKERMDESRHLKFKGEVKHAKIFGTCPRVLKFFS